MDTGNVGRYCDRGADSLLLRAIASPKADRRLWHEFMRRVEEDAPAAFLYTQTYLFAVNRRFRDVTITPGIVVERAVALARPRVLS